MRQWQDDWHDGYTSALANALEAGYINDDQHDDLYTEVEPSGKRWQVCSECHALQK